uniref:Immunoglobulin V-set domain-containing protein n=1 Tax=Ailuropoda melanoleuca TaxID=9646 RepID=A0A7N5K0B6_AILME
MELPSAPPRRGRLSWQELLLAVSLLTFWNPPTTAEVTVESVPPNATEGKDVLLRAHSLPGDLLGCNWFRGETLLSPGCPGCSAPVLSLKATSGEGRAWSLT